MTVLLVRQQAFSSTELGTTLVGSFDGTGDPIGNKRLVVIAGGSWSTGLGAKNIATVTYAGQTLTRLRRLTAGSSPGDNENLELWFLNEAFVASGINTLSASWNSTFDTRYMRAYLLSNVIQETEPSGVGIGTGTTATPSIVSQPTLEDDLVIAAACWAEGARPLSIGTPGFLLDEDVNLVDPGGDNWEAILSHNPDTPAGSPLTIEINSTNSTEWAFVSFASQSAGPLPSIEEGEADVISTTQVAATAGLQKEASAIAGDTTTSVVATAGRQIEAVVEPIVSTTEVQATADVTTEASTQIDVTTQVDASLGVLRQAATAVEATTDITTSTDVLREAFTAIASTTFVSAATTTDLPGEVKVDTITAVAATAQRGRLAAVEPIEASTDLVASVERTLQGSLNVVTTTAVNADADATGAIQADTTIATVTNVTFTADLLKDAFVDVISTTVVIPSTEVAREAITFIQSTTSVVAIGETAGGLEGVAFILDSTALTFLPSRLRQASAVIASSSSVVATGETTGLSEAQAALASSTDLQFTPERTRDVNVPIASTTSVVATAGLIKQAATTIVTTTGVFAASELFLPDVFTLQGFAPQARPLTGAAPRQLNLIGRVRSPPSST